MAYLKYIDGDDPYTPVATDDITYQQINEMQDQCRRILGPREICLHPAGVIRGNAIDWTLSSEQTCTSWRTLTNDAELHIPIELKVGARITAVHTVVSGSTGATNGDILLQIHPRGDVAGTNIDIAQGTTHPWNTGGDADPTYPEGTNQQYRLTRERTGMPVTIAANTHYQITYIAPDNVSGVGRVYIWWTSIVFESASIS
jgi:hypothetical protein